MSRQLPRTRRTDTACVSAASGTTASAGPGILGGAGVGFENAGVNGSTVGFDGSTVGSGFEQQQQGQQVGFDDGLDDGFDWLNNVDWSRGPWFDLGQDFSAARWS